MDEVRELQEMRKKLIGYCQRHDCRECAFYAEDEDGDFCALNNPVCWGVVETKEDDDGGMKMENEHEKIMEAKKVLEDYCDGNKECFACAFYTAEGTCEIGCPNIWDGELMKKLEKEMPESKDEPKPTFTPAEARKRILDDAITAVCSDRCEMYGEVEDNFGVIAGLWNEYLKAITGHLVDLTPKEVAEMMILFKVGRSATALEDHRDTYVDIAGYAACAGGLCE